MLETIKKFFHELNYYFQDEPKIWLSELFYFYISYSSLDSEYRDYNDGTDRRRAFYLERIRDNENIEIKRKFLFLYLAPFSLIMVYFSFSPLSFPLIDIIILFL